MTEQNESPNRRRFLRLVSGATLGSMVGTGAAALKEGLNEVVNPRHRPHGAELIKGIIGGAVGGSAFAALLNADDDTRNRRQENDDERENRRDDISR